MSPALFTSIYAFGVKRGWADGHLVWFILIAIALLLNVGVYFIPEQAEGRPEKKVKAQNENEDDGIIR